MCVFLLYANKRGHYCAFSGTGSGRRATSTGTMFTGEAGVYQLLMQELPNEGCFFYRNANDFNATGTVRRAVASCVLNGRIARQF